MKQTLRTIKAAILVSVLAGALVAQASDKKLALTTSSPEAKAQFKQAREALEAANFQAIQGHVQNALKADSTFAMAIMLQSATQQNPQALQTLEKALKAAQNATEGERRYIQATKTYREGDAPGAIEQLQALLKDYPEDRMTWMFTAQLLQSQNRLDEAEKAYKTAMKLDDQSFRVYQLMSQLYMSQGDLEKARQVLNKAEKLSGFEQQIHTNLGTIELLTENYAKARKHYSKAVELTDRDASPFLPFFGQAWTYLYEGKHQPALELIEGYMGRYNRNGAAQNFPPVWMWNHTARIHLEFGDPKQALQDYETGYKSVPPSQLDDLQKQVWQGRMLHGKARALAKLGKFDEAQQITDQIKAMIDSDPENGNQYLPAYHYLVGYIALEKGDNSTAIEHLKQSDLTDPFHLLLLAKANEKAGNLDVARQMYQKVTESRQNNIERALSYPEAKKKLAMLSSN